jgi:hypothetical protein
MKRRSVRRVRKDETKERVVAALQAAILVLPPTPTRPAFFKIVGLAQARGEGYWRYEPCRAAAGEGLFSSGRTRPGGAQRCDVILPPSRPLVLHAIPLRFCIELATHSVPVARCSTHSVPFSGSVQ